MARVWSRLVSKRSGLALSGLILTAFASAYALEVPLGFEGFQFAPPYNTENPFDTDELMKIDSGFNVFNAEQFAGNGRTCTTCHLPEKNFNITIADIAAITDPVERAKVLSGNGVLENSEIVEELGLFNINQGFGPESEGEMVTPLGPFRASMSLGGLGFSTLNRFVCRGGPAAEPTVTMNGCALTLAGTKNGVNTTFSTIVAGTNTTREPDPREFTLYLNGALLVLTEDYNLSGTTVTMTAPPAAGARLVAYYPGSGTAVDDGTRDIMMGWAGDGALKEMFGYAGATVPEEADCTAAIDDFFYGNLTSLEKALGTFSLAAVKTHFPLSQNRTPGVDFRCPTSSELRDMAKFQKWLGRRFELDITKLVIPVADTETGRRLFSNRVASCVACHVNAGASDNQGRRKLDPIPFVNFSDGTPAPELNGGTTSLLEIIGANKASRNGARFLEPTLQTELGAAPTFPTDPGDESLRGTGGQGGFSVQSIIEATRKTQFFHNNGVEGNIEDAIGHYFTNNFHNSQGGGAIRNAFRGGAGVTAAQALEALEALSPDPINKMGLFLRALSSVYSLADCERFVDEIIFRIDNGLSPDLPVNNCKFALSDAKRVLEGVQVSPNPFKNVPKHLTLIEDKLNQALEATNTNAKKGKLLGVRGSLQGTRNSLLTTAELP